MKIANQFLQVGEYYSEINAKNTIYLHHTAGGHRPDWVIHGWDVDDDVKTKKGRIVGTSFVIGGISTTDKDTSFDGAIFRAFDEKYWAHHLGIIAKNNKLLNQQSIGIELCNYGPLKKGSDGRFYNYVNKQVPDEMVVTLDSPFRGFIHWHKYTETQIASLRYLILYLSEIFKNIPLKTPLVTPDAFELSTDALNGMPGIYSHSNVRKDKFDISPQPEIIEMLKSIY